MSTNKNKLLDTPQMKRSITLRPKEKINYFLLLKSKIIGLFRFQKQELSPKTSF